MGPKSQPGVGPKTLVKVCIKSYSISMKKQLLITSLLLGLLGPAVCQLHAQPLSIPELIRALRSAEIASASSRITINPEIRAAIFQVSRNTHLSKMYHWNPDFVKQLQGIQLAKLDQFPSILDTPVVTPGFHAGPTYTPDAKYDYHPPLLAQVDLSQLAFQEIHKEANFYAPEIEAGRALREKLQQEVEKQLQQKGFWDWDIDFANEIAKDLTNPVIQSNALRRSLLNMMERRESPITMSSQIANYYGLDGHYVTAALNYLKTNPHESTLQLRRVMHSPLVDQELKDAVKVFLSKNTLSPEECEQAHKALHDIFVQDFKRRLHIDQAEPIQSKALYLRDLTHRTQNFCEQYGRIPSGNTNIPEEMGLADELFLAHIYKDRNQIAPLIKEYKVLETTLAKYAPTLLTLEELDQKVIAFIEENGFVPRSVKEGAGVESYETVLYDNIMSYEITGHRLFYRYNKLAEQKNLPQ